MKLIAEGVKLRKGGRVEGWKGGRGEGWKDISVILTFVRMYAIMFYGFI